MKKEEESCPVYHVETSTTPSGNLLKSSTQKTDMEALSALSSYTEQLLVKSIIEDDQAQQRVLLAAYRYSDINGYFKFAYKHTSSEDSDIVFFFAKIHIPLIKLYFAC